MKNQKILKKIKQVEKTREKYDSALQSLCDEFQKYSKIKLTYSDYTGDGFALQKEESHFPSDLFLNQALEIIENEGEIKDYHFVD